MNKDVGFDMILAIVLNMMVFADIDIC